MGAADGAWRLAKCFSQSLFRMKKKNLAERKVRRGGSDGSGAVVGKCGVMIEPKSEN